jgi:hypothetical protein
MVSFSSLALVATVLFAQVGAIELTLDNWDKNVAGKSAFIKFLAPW